MHYNIAIDGPAGAGKSTIAKRVSAALGCLYADTGALYRAVALHCLRAGAATADQVIAQLPHIQISLRFANGAQHVFLGDEDVSSLIRTPEISDAASRFSAIPEVRAFLLDLQKQLAAKESLLMDGRDIGTVILPNADLKIYLTASAEERAKRRHKELEQLPDAPDYETVLREILARDQQDMTRAEAPLKQAEDAVLIDTSDLTLEESIAAVEALCRARLHLPAEF